MALIFLGESTCAICGKLLMEGQAVTGLPAIPKLGHQLYEYFDQGFHQQCFDNWDKKDEALSLIKEGKQKLKNTDQYKEWFAKHGIPKWLDE